MAFIDSLASGIGSLFGGVASAISTNKANKATIRYQTEENERNRKFNDEQARLAEKFSNEQRQASQDWQREMYDVNNAYNAPSAVMQRLQDAGLNPDLYYGGSAVSPSNIPALGGSPAGVAASSNGSVSPQNSVVDGTFLSDAVLKAAQARNINQDTENKSQENKILASDAKFRDAINQGTIDTQYADISFKGSAENLNNERVQEVRQNVDVLSQTAQNLFQNSMLVQKDIQLREQQYVNAKQDELYQRLINKKLKFEVDHQSERFYAEQKNLLTQADLSQAQITDILTYLTYKCQLANSQTEKTWQDFENSVRQGEILCEEKLGLTINNNRAQLQLDLENKYSDTINRVQITNGILKAANQVIDIPLKLINAQNQTLSTLMKAF